MAVSSLRFVAAALLITIASSASAVDVTAVKKVNMLHNDTNSPFFTSSPSGVALAQANNTSNPAPLQQVVTFKADGTVQANTVTSLTSNGTFTITGNSTSAGNWVDGNGIPAGLVLKFNTALTFSVGAGSPAGSTLTTTGINAAGGLGNGLGITQSTYTAETPTLGVSTLASPNLNEAAGPDILEVSAVTVSNIAYTGTMTETGFTFTPGTIGNFGPILLRSSGFTEAGETFALFSANNPDPLGQNRPAIGFGVPSADPSEAGRGEGFVASHVSIENSFDSAPVNGNTNIFPRQIGAFTLVPQNGTMGLKGLSYEYDVKYSIVPTPVAVPGDYNHNGIVDGADYVIWRKGDLAADSNGDSVVDQVDYDFWRARFDNTSGAGAGSGLGNAAVPEPTSVLLVAMGVLGGCIARRRARA